MKSEWKRVRAADIIEFNPRLSLPKGCEATKDFNGQAATLYKENL